MGKKGKKAAGRAGAKQKAKGRNSTTPRSNQKSRGYMTDDWDDDEPVRFRGFAQSSSAIKTAAATASFGKLRHQGISFVSAGPIEQLQKKSPHLAADEGDLQINDDIALDDSDDEEFDDEDDVDDATLQTNIVIEQEDMDISEKSLANMHIHTAGGEMMDVDAVDRTMDGGNLPFVVDTIGDASLAETTNSSKRPAKRAPSPAPSNSSEEVVVFHGRSKATVINDPVQGPAPSSTLPLRQQAPPSQGWGLCPSKHDTSIRPGDKWTPAPDQPYWRKGKGRAVPRPDLAPSAAEVELLENAPPKPSKVQFADSNDDEKDAEQVIAALTADLGSTLRQKKKLKESVLPGGSKRTSRRGKQGRKKDNRAMSQALITDDDGSEAAYEDYMENLKAQLDEANSDEESDVLIAHLRATTRPSAISGPSLVVDGEVIEDEEVLPRHMKLESLDDTRGDIQWQSDAEEWKMKTISSDGSESDLNPDYSEISTEETLNASDLESDLEYTEREQWEDEDDLRQRRIDALDDETIARLLAKQEELGMDADELLLEDGNYSYMSDDGFGDVARARAGLSEIDHFMPRSSGKNGVRSRNRGTRGNRDFFPDASLTADAVEQYGNDGFDIMDFDRPSLRPTKKGRKGRLPPELEVMSDEDLKADMAAAWEKDRVQKRQKKLEREELRAEGLLGAAGRKGRADLSKKYPLGMNIHQVWAELAEFLQNEDLRERAFPPMDKVDRKALHDVATALNLSSKSQGSGMKRFPIIYKTSMTEEYSSEQYRKVISASTRGFLTNRGAAKKMARKAAKSGGKFKGKGGGGTSAATVRPGEVVGTGAAEISQNSFGHKLMEKMGWSKGRGLGKDGEGLLTPVEQIMRVGTAGLG